MKLLLTGATGFLGRYAIAELDRQPSLREIVVLSRNGDRAERALRGLVPTKSLVAYDWDVERESPPPAAFADIDAVLHLAGENVGAGRWSAETKRGILRSREWGTRHLVEGLHRAGSRAVFVSGSAIGYYGSRGDELLTEASSAGTGFLAGVCEAWEREARRYTGGRTVLLRTGVALGADGGALAKLLPVFRAGAGGKLGNGKAYLGWIAAEDWARAAVEALTNPKLEGPVNVVAPHPVTNADFTATLGRVLHRPTLLTVPPLALKLALGEMADETVLASQRVVPGALSAAGFEFRYPEIGNALASVLA